MNQPTLCQQPRASAPRPAPDAYPPPGRQTKLDRAFWAFHEANPQVYDLLASFARRAQRAGHERYSIKGLFELVRWHTSVETADGQPVPGVGRVKLNNNATAHYARLLMHREPDLRGFFSTRVQKSADPTARPTHS
ncbi:MAG: hypothetical protein AAGG50_13335 [Bacteroidota bacterium]